jgi:GDPmannose 4,6-dehydratase
LLEKGYIVHGIKRRAGSFNTQRVDHIDQDYKRRDGQSVVSMEEAVQQQQVAEA